MNNIEKRARELLAAECRKRAFDSGANQILKGSNLPPFGAASLNAVIAALTPPDGWVLMPVDPTSEMQDAVESMKVPHALLRTGVPLADFRERYAAMLAACPEVPNER